jgi:putative ubiquitin-RnfH superfamily antitoxin RatB of RatAB toxin-antitoxin module
MRCAFAAALPGWQGELVIEMPAEADVSMVLSAAREELARQLGEQAEAVLALPVWQHGAVGVFGEICERNRGVAADERVELYMPLKVDPKAARRQRAQKNQTEKGRNPLTVKPTRS